ncbi:MAG: tetratricopeptide repeat protein [Hyphomicrobium sp.]|jgi:tetratricopeptide (TPR) repeat protein
MRRFLRLFCVAVALGLVQGHPALAVDTVTTKDAPDLTSVRAKIDKKDWAGANAELTTLVDQGIQHADVYNLMGYTSRNLGDTKTALTFYGKALDFNPNHKGAHEYLGELHVKLGDLTKANEQVAILQKLCPDGCEELADLRNEIAKATAASPPAH